MDGRVADLHMHSTASDGIDFPEDLVQKAAQNGICAIAITDHDTVAGVFNAITAGNRCGIEVIPGVEFSVKYKPIMHILGLFLNIDNPELIYSLKSVRNKRSYLIFKAFSILRNRGLLVDPRDVMRHERVLSLKTLSNYLVNSKMVTSKLEVDEILSIVWQEWYRSLPSPEKCISLIHACGGVAILAHPQLLFLCDQDLKEELSQLKVYGLDGIEIFHPKQHDKDRRKLKKWADELNLLVSGGSDYHGNNTQDLFPTTLSNSLISYSAVEKMKLRIEEREIC